MTEKITPETYEKMNQEFIEEGTMVRIEVPTQEGIDKHKDRIEDIHSRTVPPTDAVAEMWDKYREDDRSLDEKAAFDILCRLEGLLPDATVKYYTCSDRTTTHKKIVIEYGHANKDSSNL